MTCPDILYKYASAPTAKIILESEKLRWSSPSLFNDLNEFHRMPVFSPTLEEDWGIYIRKLVDLAFADCDRFLDKYSNETRLLLFLTSQLKSTVNSREELYNLVNMKCPSSQSRMTDILREFSQSLNNDSARVFCLTSEFDNDVMWAHYADNHSGCVIGFKHLPERDTPFQEAKPINYTCGLPVIGRGSDYLLYGNTPELRRKTMHAIVYSKDIRWKYENEWRVVTWRSNEIGKQYSDYKFFKEELESVTLGPRINDSIQQEIRNLLSQRYPSCKIYKVVNQKGVSERRLITE